MLGSDRNPVTSTNAHSDAIPIPLVRHAHTSEPLHNPPPIAPRAHIQPNTGRYLLPQTPTLEPLLQEIKDLVEDLILRTNQVQRLLRIIHRDSSSRS
jgi:hypothetical protein